MPEAVTELPEYTLVRSRRRTLALEITPSGQVIARAPLKMSRARIQAFVLEKADWIRAHLARARRQNQLAAQAGKLTKEELSGFRGALEPVLRQRAAHFAAKLGVSYGKITLRCQRTRWGSCSARGNLSFNCLLALAPSEVLDYVVVHELCHRKQMNHSPAFWREVAAVLPGYPARREWLKINGPTLLARLPDE